MVKHGFVVVVVVVVSSHVCTACPTGKISAGSHDASGADTTCELTTTTTTTTNPCLTNHVELEFWNSLVYHSNLNGLGPHPGDQAIRVSNLGTNEGKTFDLLVRSVSDRYETPAGFAAYNGVYGYFAYLTM